jgi:cytochrome c553
MLAPHVRFAPPFAWHGGHHFIKASSAMRNLPSTRLLAAVAVLATGAATAQTLSEAHPALPSCHSCHGRAGISERDSVPNLAGQKAGYLASQLDAFKQGRRKHDLMNAIAAQLSTQDMRALAEHWAGLPAAPAPGADRGVVPVRSRMAWPERFPQGFERYRTVVEDTEVVQRWANRVALQAAASGLPLPEGSVLVVSHHAPQRQADGSIGAGPVRSYDTMEMRAGWGAAVPSLLRNGDWDYAQFNAQQQRVDTLNQAACLACHQPLAAKSHVFTLDELVQHAKARR